MSIITDIEAKILELEGGAFQELCDNYLYQKNNYENITQYGKEAGTMKTAKGTPDTYFKNSNGKYVLVQYTTEKGKIFEKIKKDIEKCLSSGKIKIGSEFIEEIIYCHTSSRLSIDEDCELNKLCSQNGIKLSIYGINTISNDIYYKYPIIAKDFLGMSIDTQQIMTINDFIKEYDSNKMLAPISTIFLFRENEKNELLEAIKNNDIVIISGQAGVGKTRLALEVVKEFEKNYSYKLLCIRSKKIEIFEDVKRYINKDENYILFIDDANELNQLELVLALLNKSNTKIVITVRNYEKENVVQKINKYTDRLYEKEIESFSKEEIKEFLKQNLNILNPKYIEQILKISNGNPRIAYMSGKVAIEKRSLESIYNVDNLYESYYSIIPLELDDNLYITGSIISIFGTIDFSNSFFYDIIKMFNLSEIDFLNNVKRLEKAEYVDIKYETTIRILDQCFANYLLYKTFIKNKIIKLHLIIELGFEKFRENLIKMLQMFTNIYYSKETLEYIKEEVNIVWKKYEEEKHYLLEDFIKAFYSLNETKVLTYIYERVEKSEEKELNIKNLTFNKEVYNNILKLFPKSKQSNDLENVFELLLMYLSKRKDLIEEGYKLIERNYGIIKDSFEENYITQIKLLNKFSEYMNIKEIRILFYKVAEYFLKINFLEIESYRNQVTFHNFSLSDGESVRKYRKKIWYLLLQYFNIEERDYIFILLESLNYYFNKKEYIEILEIDKPFIKELLKRLTFFDEIRANKIYLSLNKRYKFYDEEIEKNLTSTKFKIYKSLCIKYNLTNKKFKEEIQELSNEISLDEVFEIIFTFSLKEKEEIFSGIEYFIENFYTSIDNLKKIFLYCLRLNTEFYFYPRSLLLNMFEKMGVNESYKIINNISSNNIKNNWKFLFFELLPESEINIFYKDELLKFINEDTEVSFNRNIIFLKKYYSIENNIYVLVTRILYNKNNSNIFKAYHLSNLFYIHYNSPQDILKFFKEDLELLKNIYFTLENKNSILEDSDYDGSFFYEFLNHDFDYLTRYLKILKDNFLVERNKLKKLWNKENYIEIFDYIFEYLIENFLYIDSELLSVIFFNENSKVNIWFEHVIDKYFDNEDKILFLFDIICQLDEKTRYNCIIYVINKNISLDLFEKISLEPRSRGWTGSKIPLLVKDIEFCKSLISTMNGLKFIKYKNNLLKRINYIEENIKKIEKREYLEKCY